MKHILKLQPRYYESMKNGVKQIELRLFDEKRKNIKIGDEIEFKKEPDLNESFIARVKAILLYENFESLIDDYPIEILSDLNTNKKELVEELKKIYSKQKQEQYNVVGIRVELN